MLRIATKSRQIIALGYKTPENACVVNHENSKMNVGLKRRGWTLAVASITSGLTVDILFGFSLSLALLSLDSMLCSSNSLLVQLFQTVSQNCGDIVSIN